MKPLPDPLPLGNLDDLVACPQCDTLYAAQTLPENARAHCKRCGIVMVTARPAAIAQVLSLAITAFVLMIAAISFPFLDLTAAGRGNSTSVLSAIFAFSDTLALPLAFAVAGFIIVIPLMRLMAIIYAIGPLVSGTRPRRGARSAFRLAERLRPWSMAEIFIVGVAVALVKVAGVATITFGPAFWAFAGLVVITALKDQLICRYSIWEALDTRAPRG
ncbi:paraquat-inducible protein A [Yoonia sp. 208BN28-4]|uniref:paraquat-inducible protein A n=1 Tax=Yoonia sp. 208BN28-4 TaxID=3126505 RepID=UPI003095079E